MQRLLYSVAFFFLLLAMPVRAQQGAIINNANSPHSRLQSVDLTDITLTDGFWKEKFDLVAEKTLPAVWAVIAGETGNH